MLTREQALELFQEDLRRIKQQVDEDCERQLSEARAADIDPRVIEEAVARLEEAAAFRKQFALRTGRVGTPPDTRDVPMDDPTYVEFSAE